MLTCFLIAALILILATASAYKLGQKKEAVMSIPNFDADIFFECTGIRV